jgi:superfamily II DNA/RNA helicase
LSVFVLSCFQPGYEEPDPDLEDLMRAQPAQAHVLIGTLGTLKNFSAKADLQPHFARVTMLVVDEVDQVLVDERSQPMRLNKDAAELRRCVLMVSILSVSVSLSP